MKQFLQVANSERNYSILYICVILEAFFLKKCVPFDNMGTCFIYIYIYIYIYINTEQNGPLVLQRNQLFRVPNHERSKLVLDGLFENYCS